MGCGQDPNPPVYPRPLPPPLPHLSSKHQPLGSARYIQWIMSSSPRFYELAGVICHPFTEEGPGVKDCVAGLTLPVTLDQGFSASARLSFALCTGRNGLP